MNSSFLAPKRSSIGLFASVAVLAIGFALPSAHGQIFVSYGGGNTIDEFDATTGTAISRPLIADSAYKMWISGDDLFVTNGYTVSEYTTSGQTVAKPLISGSTYFFGIAGSGSNLFVSTYDYPNSGLDGTVGEYTTSGKRSTPLLFRV